ncbi:MAG: hypothetical protein RMH81_05010 [Thermomicrobium sp.]|nr:hypothetical protein [Thermomicrobium sp.]
MQGTASERGTMLLRELAEIWPSEASSRLRPVYDDLRTALRIPDVPFVFRFLAQWPPYLAYAVRQFSPFVRSLAFEDAADAIRSEVATSLGSVSPDARFESARALVLREQQLAPKVLLIVTAFSVGLNGRASDVPPLLDVAAPQTEPRPVRPAELPRAIDERIQPLPDLRTIAVEGRALLAEVEALRGTPALDDCSRALAATHPDLLRQLVETRRATPAEVVSSLRARLQAMADRAVRRFTLPGGKVLADFMVPASAVPDLHAVLVTLQAIALDALLDATLARVILDGVEEATRAPYPLAELIA